MGRRPTLWYEVKTWANNNGYTFAYVGREGSHGSDGKVPTGEKDHPVTYISWRDCIMWCNALSEKENLTPIYYTDETYLQPLRFVTTSTSLSVTQGQEDNPYVKWDNTGYRLPTEVEWEIAARGAGAAVSAGSYGTKYSGSEIITGVGWHMMNSSRRTHKVGEKTENELGIVDMSGNTYEWCWDWYGSLFPFSEGNPIGPATGTGRQLRGGSYTVNFLNCQYFQLL